METVDVIIEVLDARMPEASSNPMITELRLHRQRPCLKVLNKADLAAPPRTSMEGVLATLTTPAQPPIARHMRSMAGLTWMFDS